MRIIKESLFFLIVFLFGCSNKKEPQTLYNLDFEKMDSLHRPADWILSYGVQNKEYLCQLDSVIKQHGKYSLKIAKRKDTTKNSFAVCAMEVNTPVKGQTLKVSAYVKTQDVADGYAGLWARVDGEDKPLAFDNMYNRGITGTTGWAFYSIELPYYASDARRICIGALLTGSGKMWVDNFKVSIDGVVIKEKGERRVQHKANEDTAYNKHSPIISVNHSRERLQQLTNIGMLWGFLKYYHPSIAKGEYNWDAELFRFLKKIESESDSSKIYEIMERWVDSLGPVEKRLDKEMIMKSVTISRPPSFGYLFNAGNLPLSLVKKLNWIKENYAMPAKHYYIDFSKNIGNSVFNELAYSESAYPDVGVRLLSLYRYWNEINYFFPYRHLISEDWNKVLTEFIPVFIDAKNKEEYTLACLKLIARIHDSHAGIWGNNPVLDSIKGGLMVPFKAVFIENKLIVSNYYKDTLGIKQLLHLGDVIEKINGIPVQDYVNKYLPVTPGSNIDAQLRDLPSVGGFLFRGNEKHVELLINTGKEHKKITIERVPFNLINLFMDFGRPTEMVGYRFLPGNIGYIYPAKLNETDVNDIKVKFSSTKGIVIDMRCYPSTFMPFTYGEWLKSSTSDFASFTVCNLISPGSTLCGTLVSNGGSGAYAYKKKVVIIVNAQTQSQAEYTTMALSSRPNTIVLGSTTAGADGNVSPIILPGNISTAISGIGVYYPDLTETQRVGVKIDVPMRPTIKGIREGRDELLEKAIELINRQ